MMGMWTALLLGGKVTDLKTNRLGMMYHISAEYITGALLVMAGVLLILEVDLSLEIGLVAFGMLLYTVINSSGYYAQRGERGMVVMFSMITVLTLLAILGLIL